MNSATSDRGDGATCENLRSGVGEDEHARSTNAAGMTGEIDWIITASAATARVGGTIGAAETRIGSRATATLAADTA